ncbi:MAG: hypothetical protein RRY34_06620, partial [Victivallaceae bacterium]
KAVRLGLGAAGVKIPRYLTGGQLRRANFSAKDVASCLLAKKYSAFLQAKRFVASRAQEEKKLSLIFPLSQKNLIKNLKFNSRICGHIQQIT